LFEANGLRRTDSESADFLCLDAEPLPVDVPLGRSQAAFGGDGSLPARAPSTDAEFGRGVP